jgi:putative lipoic acid-binding regulatory protein
MSDDLDPDSDADDLFNFPCEFPVKAMGKSCPELEIAVIEIMNRHVPDLGEGAVRMRPSSKGNYISITVTIQAQSREQLDAIYMDLTACELVAYAI